MAAVPEGAVLVDADAVLEDPVRAEQGWLEGRFTDIPIHLYLMLCDQ